MLSFSNSYLSIWCLDNSLGRNWGQLLLFELSNLKRWNVTKVDRLNNDYELIGKNMFKKETNLSCFIGLKISLTTGEVGVIEGTFGQSGKFKIRLNGKTIYAAVIILSFKLLIYKV